MPSYLVYLDAVAARRLAAISAETGRSIEQLIASAAEEEALGYYRHRSDDPGRPPQPRTIGERA